MIRRQKEGVPGRKTGNSSSFSSRASWAAIFPVSVSAPLAFLGRASGARGKSGDLRVIFSFAIEKVVPQPDSLILAYRQIDSLCFLLFDLSVHFFRPPGFILAFEG
jgi:hypothetical protein